jgi:hypothetical protein
MVGVVRERTYELKHGEYKRRAVSFPPHGLLTGARRVFAQLFGPSPSGKPPSEGRQDGDN